MNLPNPSPVSQGNACRLASRLSALASEDDEYWSFTERAKRDFTHSLFQYPAMMVPQLQRSILEELLEYDSSIRRVYDPFNGSGTVMTEVMLRGLDFMGCDINPLAHLISRAKCGTFDADLLSTDLTQLKPFLECRRG